MIKTKLAQQIKTIDHKYKLQLQQYFKAEEGKKLPVFVLNGSGCRQKSMLMPLATFRIAVCFAMMSAELQKTYSMMITASHNPACDNGIKVGYASQNLISIDKFKMITDCINDDHKFYELVHSRIQAFQQKIEKKQKYICSYVGRDCRTSSPHLHAILCQTFKMLGVRVIDLGICTTPQLFSLSEYVQDNYNPSKNSQINVQAIKMKYVQQVMETFFKFHQKLNKVNQCEGKVNKFSKILLDFSNGSGAIAIKPYQKYLQKLFEITKINNTDFSNPNEKCGADFYYKNWSVVQSQDKFRGFNQCFFFDGDSDRVIAKVHEIQDRPFQGNYFLIYYALFITEIIMNLQKQKLISQQIRQSFKIYAIGTVVMNLGVKLKTKKLGIQFVVSDVGTLNLFKQAKNKKGISIFFQPNGHGGIYFSSQTLSTLHQLKKNHENNLQIDLLLGVNTILKNNSRGYGLHNMLIFYLCKLYLNKINLKDLLQFAFQTTQPVHVKLEHDSLYKNGQQKSNQLTAPLQISHFIDDMCKNNQQYLIIVRKSATQKALIRINVQGAKEEVCHSIAGNIKKFIQQYDQNI